MWPWEHAAVGYLCYSLARRAIGRDPPSNWSVLALAVATQLPDLFDKTLSWGFGLFETGYALGHSVFLAGPVGLLVVLLGPALGRATGHDHDYRGPAVAFTVGYWSHLAADVLDPLRRGAAPLAGRVLWPISEATPYATDYGLSRGIVYLQRFLRDLSTMSPTAVLAAYLLLPLVTLAVWFWDGTPGLPTRAWLVETVRRF